MASSGRHGAVAAPARGQCTAPGCDDCRSVRTVCYMCSSECGLDVHERGGEIRGLFGVGDHPMNRGALCPKAFATPNLLGGDRIERPLRRIGPRGEGRFEPVSWERALDEIAERLVAHKRSDGPASLLVQFGEKPDHDMVYRFANAYGTPNVLDHDSICDTNRRGGFMLTYGTSHFRPLPDLGRPIRTTEGERVDHDCRYLLLIGENPMEATRFLYLREGIPPAIRQGMRLTVADPCRTQTAKLAHDWLPVRPGSDLALVLALLRHAIENDDPSDPERRYLDHGFIEAWTDGFDEVRERLLGSGDRFSPEWAAERTGVDADTIRRVAHEFAITKPAAAMVGMNGVGHHGNGFLTTRAVAVLVAVTGNLDVPGGLALAPRPRLDTDRIWGTALLPEHAAQRHKDLFAGHPLAHRGIKAKDPKDILEGVHLSHGVHAGESYRIRSLFVIHGNPLINAPASGRWRDALTRVDERGEHVLPLVVFNDLHLNDTGLFADYVLPMASFVERQGLCQIYTVEPAVSLREPVLAPQGESRTPRDWLRALADACAARGDDDLAGAIPYDTDDEWCDEALAACPGLPGVPSGVAPDGEPLTVDWLRSHGGTVTWPARYRKYDLLDTPTGRVEIVSRTVESVNREFGTDYEPLLEHVENRWDPASPSHVDQADEYPYQLITGRSLAHTGSFTQNLEKTHRMQPEPGIELSRRDAEREGLKTGDRVRLRNPLGSHVEGRVTVLDGLRSGVVRARHGWGQRSPFLSRSRGRGYNVNELTDDENYNPVTGNAGLGDMMVAIERVDPALES